MTEQQNANTVRQLWKSFNRRDFEAARNLIHPEFVCLWPSTRERIVGPDNFIAVNQNYPGNWQITIERVLAAGDQVVSEVTVEIDGRQEPAVSFFELREGKIIKLTEYWPIPYEPPVWRSRWVARY